MSSHNFLVKDGSTVTLLPLKIVPTEQFERLCAVTNSLIAAIEDDSKQVGELLIHKTDTELALSEMQSALQQLNDENRSLTDDIIEIKAGLERFDRALHEALQVTQTRIVDQMNSEIDLLTAELATLSTTCNTLRQRLVEDQTEKETIKTRLSLLESADSRRFLAPNLGSELTELIDPTLNGNLNRLLHTGPRAGEDVIGFVITALKELNNRQTTLIELPAKLQEVSQTMLQLAKRLNHIEHVVVELTKKQDQGKQSFDDYIRQLSSKIYTQMQALENKIINIPQQTSRADRCPEQS